MPYNFTKGMKRPPGAGRRKGALNKKTIEIREFAKTLLEGQDYKDRLKVRIQIGKAPEIEKLLYHYAYGRPPDKVEVTNPDGSLRPTVQFYIPDNFRPRRTGDAQ